MSQELVLKKKNFDSTLEKYKPTFDKSIPQGVMRPEYFMRVVSSAVAKTPKLLDCKPESLFGAIIQASQLGLAPDGFLGHAYILPYGTNASLQIGYKGILQLLKRTGKVKSVKANVVYKGDIFEYDLSDGVSEHKRTEASEYSDDAITHVYARIMYENGGEDFDVWTKGQVDFHMKKYSKGYNYADSPWKTNYPSMAKKTLIIQAAKYAELSTELQVAIGMSEVADNGGHQNNAASLSGTELEAEFDPYVEITETEQVSAVDKLKDKSDASLNSVKK